MKHTLIVVALLFSSVLSASVVLPPVGEDGEEIAFVIVSGNLMEYTQYIEIAESVQNEASDNRVWCYVTDDDVTTGTLITDARDALVSAGMSTDGPLFVAGQDTAGAALFREAVDSRDEVGGVILWGSVVDLPLEDLTTTPVLHIVGDLDGIIRITSMAQMWRQILDLVEADPDNVYRYPMRVLDGVNHVQYVTGEVPEELRQFVIQPEAEDETARGMIAETTVTFILNSLQQELNQASLDDWYNNTMTTMKPIVDMFEVEYVPNLSPWALTTQEIVADLTEEDSARVEYINYVVPTDVISGARSNVTADDDGNVEVLTVSAVTSYEDIPVPWAYEAGDMLETKMKSQEGILSYLYPDDASDVVPNTKQMKQDTSCKDSNVAAWSLALSSLSEKSYQRFMEQNLSIDFLDDIEATIGPEWIAADLVYEYEAGTLSIQSTNLITGSIIGPELGGVHYCKHLSPAKAMEFMLIDGLRQPLTLP